MILMLGEILLTKHLSLKRCVHCIAAALAWDHAVSELCKAGRQGLVKPITWLESLLMDPIKHAHIMAVKAKVLICTHSFMT